MRVIEFAKPVYPSFNMRVPNALCLGYRISADGSV